MSTIHLAARLKEPIWHPQEGETPAESRAFGWYLQERSQRTVCERTGLAAAVVGEVAVRWSWHARVMAYDKAVAATGFEARAARIRAVLAERTELIAETLRHAGAIVSREMAAHRAVADRAPAGQPAYSVRELAQLAAIEGELAERARVDLRPETAQVGEPGNLDFDSLPQEDLASFERISKRLRGL